jgi:hypothetical protein
MDSQKRKFFAGDRVQRVITTAKWRLMPLIVVLYLIAFMDRVNVAFAVLTINKDVGIMPAVYGLGGGIGYALFRVHSLMLLRVGGPLVISIQAWRNLERIILRSTLDSSRHVLVRVTGTPNILGLTQKSCGRSSGDKQS